MTTPYKKYKFSGISIKKGVATRFRKFSKQISKSNTEALEEMLNFFYRNEISPNDNLDVKNDGTKKRINALIAILKNIEKHQTKPTTIMLQSLFEETINAEKEEEEHNFESPILITENEELTYYRNEYYKAKENYNQLKHDIDDIIQKTKYVKSNFGTGHFRLEINKEEFEKLKS